MANYQFVFHTTLLLLLVILPFSKANSGGWTGSANRFYLLDQSSEEADENGHGTTWAVLVAGSNGYYNYRHQADVCHAYQILKRGGLKDENIVVFMYDDIATNELNPRPGIIINHPHGQDVYAGVPKDYTGENVTAENFYAVLLGDKTSVKGGSGKVVKSKQNDRIFIYYTDHGATGLLSMPSGDYVYADDFIKVLKKKHKAKTYKKMVIYVEACESGSMFEGLLPKDMNIYAMTASNASESSWGAYCPDDDDPPPPEYSTCLGDLYSISWMEDSDVHNLKKETIKNQYLTVKERVTDNHTYIHGSHVMEYGQKSMNKEKLQLYQGFDPASETLPPKESHFNTSRMGAVSQRDADLLSLWQRFKKSSDGPEKKAEIFKEIAEVMAKRTYIDNSVDMIGKILFEPRNANAILERKRDQGMPVVDNWDCLKSMVRSFERHCGSLTKYGLKHVRAFANICNNGITPAAMDETCMTVCSAEHAIPSAAANGV